MAKYRNHYTAAAGEARKQSMFKRLKDWWVRRYRAPFTVACDTAPCFGELNRRERLIQVHGLARAIRTARRWVLDHPHGRARIGAGHCAWADHQHTDWASPATKSEFHDPKTGKRIAQ